MMVFMKSYIGGDVESAYDNLDNIHQIYEYNRSREWKQDKVTDEWVSELSNLTKLVHAFESKVNELFAPVGDGYKQIDYEKSIDDSLDTLGNMCSLVSDSYCKLIRTS